MKKYGIALLGLLILVGLLSGCGSKTAARPSNGGGDRSQALSTVKVEQGNISNRVTLSGKIAPQEEVKVMPKSPGKVAKVRAEVGQKVAAGEVLLELDNDDIQASLQSAQADILSGQADLTKAQATLEDAQRTLERKKSLLDQGVIAQSEFDQAKNSYDQAQSGLDSSKAKLEKNQAVLRQQNLALENSILRSPIDGIITAKNVGAGELASSSTPAYVVMNIDKVEVESALAEGDVNQVKSGEGVQVKVDSVGSDPFTGVISRISPAADEKLKAFPLWFAIDNPEHLLKPGMVAEIQLQTGGKEGVLTLPVDCIVEKNGAKFVFTVQEGKAVLRKVETGVTDGVKMEILSGLQAGEEVIVNPPQNLAEGAPVTLANGSKPETKQQ